MKHVPLDFLVLELSTYETFESKDRVCGIDHGLPLGWQTNQPFTVLREGDDGRSCACTFRVLNNASGFTLHDGNARIGSTQVDANHRPCHTLETW